MSKSEEAVLKVNGAAYTGWNQVTVTRSMEELAHCFSIDFIPGTGGLLSAKEGLHRGDTCVLEIGDKPVVTGFISTIDVSYDARSVRAQIDGRSKTGDLADCSAIKDSGFWKNASAKKIIEDLCAPFGIKLEANPALGSHIFPYFELDEGERAHETIERLLRVLGYCSWTTPDGNLKIDNVSKLSGLPIVTLDPNTTFSRSIRVTEENLYSKYRVSQQVASQDDSDVTIFRWNEVSDSTIKRYRPTVVQVDTHVGALKDSANWIRNTSVGKSISLSYEVPGVYDPEGKVWEPPMMVAVQDDAFGINETLLLTEASINISESNISTNIRLTFPEAYTTNPLPEKFLNQAVRLSDNPDHVNVRVKAR